MKAPKIQKSKKYKTRDGEDVIIYTTEGGGDYPVHGAVKVSPQQTELQQWTSDGRFYINRSDEDGRDLFEDKARREYTYWVRYYYDGSRGISDKKFKTAPNETVFAEIKHTTVVTEGQGLDNE